MSRRRPTDAADLVGDQSARVTPVPIPNTAVKPCTPMILLTRESRSSPTYEPRPPKADGALFMRRPDGVRIVSSE